MISVSVLLAIDSCDLLTVDEPGVSPLHCHAVERLVHNSHRIRLKKKSMRKVEQRPQRTIDQGT